MGYRIDITIKGEENNKDLKYYGTKHYGYCSVDETTLDSYKYLQSIGKMPNPEEEIVLFDYGCDNEIELTAKEFEKFITLYNKEYMSGISWGEPHNMLEEENMKNILKDKRNKIVSWG